MNNDLQEIEDKSVSGLFYVSVGLDEEPLLFQDKELCSTETAELIVDSAVEFCEAISYRVEDNAPCYLLLSGSVSGKEFLRLNPERSGGTILDSRQSILISSLEKTEFSNTRIGDNEGALLFAFETGYRPLWDYAFLKVSAWIPNRTLTFFGWHDIRSVFSGQKYLGGELVEGIESDGAEFLVRYPADSFLDQAGITERDFNLPRSQWSFYAD